MPVITVQFIKDVVATPEQKKQLIIELTNTFVGILGDVVRPFVYCIIQETPQQEWGIAGVPMPDLVYLTSDKHAGVIERSNSMMRGAIAQMAAQSSSSAGGETDEDADAVWRGASGSGARSGSGASETDEDADALWRGAAGGAAGGGAQRNDADWRYWQRWFEELWNKENYNIVYEYVGETMLVHGAGGQVIKDGPEGPKGMVKAWKTAMPDGKVTIDDIITEGELSTIRATFEGTHTGNFGNIAPSGKHVKVSFTGIDKVVNGKIVEGWGEVDMLSMFQQMGVIPTP